MDEFNMAGVTIMLVLLWFRYHETEKLGIHSHVLRCIKEVRDLIQRNLRGLGHSNVSY
jgi:hypothetical protein